MRPSRSLWLLAVLLAPMTVGQSALFQSSIGVRELRTRIDSAQANSKPRTKILQIYGNLPLSFEANRGQTDSRVRFVSRSAGYTLFLTGDEAVLALSGNTTNKDKSTIVGHLAPKPGIAARKDGSVLRMRLRNANPSAKVTGTGELAGTSNYFIGNDPEKWRNNVPTYAKVQYEGIYSGIDLVYYGNQRQLEYDFIVAPGADPRRILFDVDGAKEIRRDAQGGLVFSMKTGEDEIRWHKPRVYQKTNGARHEITAHYSVTGTNRVGFELAKYDARRPLYIDPLVYSTYLGGSDDDLGESIAVDSAGNAYITGYTRSTNFPTMNPVQPVYGGGSTDAFIVKINAAGSALVYSTYLGGSDIDSGSSIAVDSAGNAYVTGYTYSTDFPSINALQPTFGGGTVDAFVAEINSSGSALIYSTYLGGSGDDLGNGIAVDSAGNAYVTGGAGVGFPLVNALQSTFGGGYSDAFVAKISAEGSALVYSTYLGGSAQDDGNGIAVDNMGNAYLCGTTASADFPTMAPLQSTYGGGEYDGFVAKINPMGSVLIYSTYLGGSGFDVSIKIALDSSANAYVTGQTDSTNFPITPDAYQATCVQCANESTATSVSEINAAGSALAYSTYLGGSDVGAGEGIAVDGMGNAYVTGQANSQAFVTELNSTGTASVYSIELAGDRTGSGMGIAVDGSGNTYVTGQTNSTNFPTMNPFQAANGGGIDAFVTKISFAPTTTALISFPNPSVSGMSVTFTATVSSSSSGTPAGNVTFKNGSTVLIKKALSGGAVKFTTTELPPGSNPITAVYGGDSSFGGSSSSPVNQFVLEATATTLTSSPNPSTYGQAVILTALVTSTLGVPPDGEMVTFKQGSTVLGSGTLSNGEASFSTTTIGTGTKSITAVYAGDATFGTSTSKTISQVVSKAAAITSLFSSQDPSSFSQSVTFTATVSPEFTGTPTGSVTFKNGTEAMATVTLNSGVASHSTTKLATGAYPITAVYGGDSSFLASTSNTLSQVVNAASTTTTLVSSLNPSDFGQSVTFTATIAPEFGGTVTGSVTFMDGTTTLKTVSFSGGTAKYTTTKLASGSHNITASYNGGSDFATSSASLTQTVN
jgi:Bacterial Ig-like domain (group 3)/Beta-propeller repeat